MQKISWTDRVRTEEVLHRVKEERNILHTVKRRKANWIGHILGRNCLLKHTAERRIEGRKEVMGERRGRHKQLLHDLQRRIGCWKLTDRKYQSELAFERAIGLTRDTPAMNDGQ
jgi:hypothetical protein